MREWAKHSAFAVFVSDWSEYLRENNISVFGKTGGIDVKILCPQAMPLKECTRLNRQLGINRINYKGNANGLTIYRKLKKDKSNKVHGWRLSQYDYSNK
jgi:hypothetical protein